MKTASPEFNESFRNDTTLYAAHKVICEFGSNRFNDNQVVTASSTKVSTRGTNEYQKKDVNFWRAEDAFNNKNHNSMKWLVCDSGAKVNVTADGTGYRSVYLDSELDLEHGWWSAVASNSSGEFTTPQWVQSTFDARGVNNITLYLTEGYPTMKRVTVEYRNEADAWVPVEAERVLSSTEYQVVWELTPVVISGLRVTVHATHRPNDVARISELNG